MITPAAESPAPRVGSVLDRLVELEVLAPLDRRFAELLARLDPAASMPAIVAAAVAFAARERGHVCLDLDDASQRSLLASTTEARSTLDSALEGAAQGLASASFVRPADSSEETPLVLEGRRLYLDRLHLAEQELVAAIRARLEAAVSVSASASASASSAAPAAPTAATLRRLFACPDGTPFTDQMRAALLASRGRFCIVTGGPGTGKTTTVVRILALLLEREPNLRIRLLAPTGKAAARLSESIRAQLATLDSPARDSIPSDASTVHRALGIAAERPSRARHDARQPLPCDVLVVDEASMVDLELMARLLDALTPTTRVVLLGDRDQLASVEAGSVFGDLCGPPGDTVLASPGLAAALADVCAWPPDRVARGPVPAIADSVAMLETSRRFDPTLGIGRLATAVRMGDVRAARACVPSAEVAHVDSSVRGAHDALEARITSVYAELVRTRQPMEALARLDSLRVLCAVRRGDDGVEGWNERITTRLVSLGLVPRGRAHYHGRPVLVLTNDYDVQLYNGDIGVELEVEGSLRVCFADPRAESGFRMVSPARVPPHETVYAMTIHKSQGSEVDEVVLVLPREESRVLGRELVYTGLTRARARVTLAGPWSAFERALGSTIVRASGVREKLWR